MAGLFIEKFNELGLYAFFCNLIIKKKYMVIDGDGGGASWCAINCAKPVFSLFYVNLDQMLIIFIF